MPRLTSAQRQKMQARLTPSQVIGARLLELPAIELSLAVQEELASNPALEFLEATQPCARCGLPAPAALCPACAMSREDLAPGDVSAGRDPLMTVAAPWSRADTLLRDLRASIDARDQAIAEAIVGNLDDHGFLATGTDAIAGFLGVAEGRVFRVLARLQELGPPGIGTGGMQEWLLLQLRDNDDPRAALAARIIGAHLDDLAANRDRAIADALGASLEDIQRVRTFMQDELRPFPLLASSATATDREGIPYRIPDIAIHDIGGVLVAEVLSSSHRWLRLSPAYADMARLVSTLAGDEQEHVRQYVERARAFLRGMANRHLTLQRVADRVVARQQRYLRDGPRHHVALTRTGVADELAMHVSSVSRAVSGKRVQLPDRRVIELAELFESSSDAKRALRRLLDSETAPRTDDELSAALAGEGFTVSRRTVAKYRDEMGVAPYRARIRAARMNDGAVGLTDRDHPRTG